MLLKKLAATALVSAIVPCSFSIAAPVKHPVLSEKPLPIFEFMGSNTEDVSPMDKIDRSTCTTEGDKISCTNFDPTLGGQSLKFLTQDFYKGKLYHIYGDFGEYAYGGLLSAFTAKYGQADHVEIRKWQSKAGATFDNNVAVWRFKGGDLELDSMGLDVNSGSFEFMSSVNSPPAPPPKVDF